MGYDLHITKKANWSQEGSDIHEADWRAYVASDTELHLAGAAEATLPGGSTLRYENPSLVEWMGHSSGTLVWFDFRDHRVVVKHPDDETIAKMQRIASSLGARVQGDDGEFYGP